MNTCKAKSEIRTIYGNVEWNPGPENRQKRVGVGLQTPRLKLRGKKESTLRKKRKYCMSEWEWVIVVSANSAIFQLCHDENKLICNEMMVRSALY
jgi:hypothetical protein